MKQNIFALLAALIWGTAFVAQKIGSNSVGGFTFTAIRSFIGVLAILVIILITNLINKEKLLKKINKRLMIGSLFCGIFLFLGANLQQIGIAKTNASKAGFITALYIVLVPIIGLIFKKKASFNVWLSVVIFAVGLYLLCIKEGFSIEIGDIYVILCALAYACHILVIDYYVQFVDPMVLSMGQFLVSGVLSLVAMFIFEQPDGAEIMKGILPILYVGIFSSGLAYTFQLIAQKGSNPTIISLIFSLESVFATLSGALFLGEKLILREYLGCAIIFIAVILSQLNFNKKEKAGCKQ